MTRPTMPCLAVPDAPGPLCREVRTAQGVVAPPPPGSQTLPPSEWAVVCLPGAFGVAADFFQHDFDATLRSPCPPARMVGVTLPWPGLEDGTQVERLHHEVILPTRAEGAGRVALLGISLGGLAAMLYAATYPTMVNWLVTLAPYPGRPIVQREIERAGGLAHWQPRPDSCLLPWERALHQWWQRRYLHQTVTGPAHCLAWGTDDRFATTLRGLAEYLPAGATMQRPGGHDWPTWLALWRELLDRQAPWRPAQASSRAS